MKKQITIHCFGPLGQPLSAKEGVVVFFANTEAATFGGLSKVARKELDKTPERRAWGIYAVQVGSGPILKMLLRHVMDRSR